MLNILLYGTVICFAVALFTWSLGELLRLWQIAIGMSIFFTIGSIVLWIRTFIAWRHVPITQSDFFMLFIMSIFCLTGLLLHLVLMRTMILPVSSVIILAFTMLDKYDYTDFISQWVQFSQPLYWWGTFSLVLAYVGSGISGGVLILGVICLWRRGKNLEEMHSSIRIVTLKCPQYFFKLLWFVLFVLLLSIGGYMLYCRMLTGMYWIWQPIYAMLSALALIFALIIHLSIHKKETTI